MECMKNDRSSYHSAVVENNQAKDIRIDNL